MTDHSTEYTGEGRRRREMRMMSRCFTWFPIGGYRRTQYIPRFGGVLQVSGDFTWSVSDSVKNQVGVTQKG